MEKNSTVVDRDILDTVIGLNEKGGVAYAAREMGFARLKVRKLLVTAGEEDGKVYYKSEKGAICLSFYHEGKTVAEIAKALQLSESSVIGYLPYTKTIYKKSEVSKDTEKLRRYHARKSVLKAYRAGDIFSKTKQEQEDFLWEAISDFQGYKIASGGKKFSYKVVGSGIEWKDNRVIRANVMKAYWKIRENEELTGKHDDYVKAIFEKMGICG